jgi:hypothetical protein
LDDGSRHRTGLRLSTQSFNLSDINLLCTVLYNKYNIKTTIVQQRVKKQITLDGTFCEIPQYVIYVTAASMPTLIHLILPYMVPSMLYKLGL